MSGSPVLVDSCWYITVARRGGAPLHILESIAQFRDVATCGIIRCEVARGIRSPRVLRHFQDAWDVMLNVPTDTRLWQEVEKLAWETDRNIGGSMPLADFIIAACARRIGAVVLTFDTHFAKIPGIVSTDRIV